MKTDRELLELAAKAAGYEFDLPMLGDGPALALDGMRILGLRLACGAIWNPLTDDGDALRLAVKLGLLVDLTKGHAMVSLTGEYEHHIDKWIDEPFGLDGNASTRRAIVRAAAAIGGSI